MKVLTGVVAVTALLNGFAQIKFQQDQLMEQQKQLSEEYRSKFWDERLQLYEQLLLKLSDLYDVPRDSPDFKQKTHQLVGFFVSNIQLVASPEVDSSFKDALVAIDSFRKQNVGLLEMSNAVTQLAICCRKDTIKELQLNKDQQQIFEANAKIVNGLFDRLLAKTPEAAGASTK